MKYSYSKINNNTRVIIYQDNKPVKNFYNMPKKLIEEIGEFLGLYLCGETCYYTGKIVYKVGIKVNSEGGVINLYTTTSKAKYNRFIVNYVNMEAYQHVNT